MFEDVDVTVGDNHFMAEGRKMQMRKPEQIDSATVSVYRGVIHEKTIRIKGMKIGYQEPLP